MLNSLFCPLVNREASFWLSKRFRVIKPEIRVLGIDDGKMFFAQKHKCILSELFLEAADGLTV